MATYVTKEALQAVLALIAEDLNAKADKDHTHEGFLTEDDIKDLATKAELALVAENDIFKADMNTVSALGGIPAGANLNGMSIQEVLTKLLYPYVKPAVSAKLTFSPNKSAYEFGETVSVSSLSTTVTKKSEAITKIAFYENGVVVEEVTEGVESGGTFNHVFEPNSEINNTISSGYFKVVVSDASGTDVTANSSAMNFYYPYYIGVIDDGVEITEELIEGLTKKVEAKGQKTQSYTVNNQRMVIAYPKAYGQLSSILDPNGFEQLATFACTELDIVGLDGTTQTYYVYANGASTNTNFKMTFKY